MIFYSYSIPTTHHNSYSHTIVLLKFSKALPHFRDNNLTERGWFGLVRGFKNGKMFSSIDDEESEKSQRIKKNWLNPETIARLKEAHMCNVGLPMELKKSGMVVDQKVGIAERFGKTYYLLKFVGEKGRVKHSIYEGTWFLYIDPVSYRIEGMRYQILERDLYVKTAGELVINGIKMRQTEIIYDSNDDSHLNTNNFTFVKE